ncbi:MAG: secretin N-terminal domain-containing protein [Planctomycetaceae bacterium]
MPGNRLILWILLIIASTAVPAAGQEATKAESVPLAIPSVVVQDGTVVATPTAPATAPVSQEAEKKPDETAATPGSTPSAEKKPDDSAGAATVRRPPAEKYVPQPIDREIRKHPDGTVTFNVVGQPWEPVLQWLADASALSLDWQELPGDSLNLITTREYTMEEARDLINRHLLTRGFTMIVNGEIMSIVRTKDINPAIVKRVTPDELEALPDHTICKVSFDLDWLIADEAVDELKPMLSSAGQIHKLSRTNRLEVIDTAVSLRQLWDLLKAEQSDQGEEQLVQAFRLKYRRAEDVIRMLRDLLKIQDSSGVPTEGMQGMDPNMVMQMMQQMQQAMQQASQAGAGGNQAKQKVETRLVLNQKENMILAQAAPDQMAVIRKAIEQIDVEADPGSTLLQNINRMKVYRLESIDPQTLADLLQQLGDLDPGTVLKVDKKKRSIIAWATLADHLTITTLVEKLDQSSRDIEVVALRRLDAEYVAGTIRLLMGNQENEDDDSSARSRYGFFDFGMMNQQVAEEPKFRVEADIENNRLLVFANNIEMDEIRRLLVKLGELPDPNAADEGIRVFEIAPDEDLEQMKLRIRQFWKRGNQLDFDFPVPEPVENSGESQTGFLPDSQDLITAAARQSDKGLPGEARSRVRIWNGRRTPSAAERRFDAFVQASEKQAKAAAANAVPSAKGDAADRRLLTSFNGTRDERSSAEKSDNDRRATARTVSDADRNGNDRSDTQPDNDSIRLSLTPDGKLLVSSTDPEALAEMETILLQLAQPRRNYKLFRLKYATPSWVALNLKDFFKADEQTKSSLDYDPFWGLVPSQKKTRGKATLGQRRQPQFISDNFTSTILVRDADARQLKTIEELIAIYDVPEPADSRSMRETTIFRLKNARASVVAAAIKDVFRDLLSSNDKALESNDKNQRPSSSGLVTFLPGSSKKEGEDDEEPIRFKGLLSIGIDDTSNTLIISSAGSLMETVTELVEALDEAADTSSVVQVMKVDKSVDVKLIEERLRKLMESQLSPKSPQPGQPGIPPNQPNGDIPGAVQEAAPSVVVPN